MEKIEYIIYTDGAYSSCRNQGGIGFLILNTDNKIVGECSKTFFNTTNNRMELIAVLTAIKSIKKATKVTIYSDSQYVIGCATLGWKRTKNQDLWGQYDKLINSINYPISFVHVKGHKDNKFNNQCDRLAVMASTKECRVG